MIPKIIHYCWLSSDPYPDKIQKCIDSWKRILPDYEIIHWNFDLFPRGKSKWVDQAFDCHKYAFAADYIRLYALYHYGGIYLDSDVEVLKSFDDLLVLPYFLGRENTPSGVEAATLGCEKGNVLIKAMYESYENREFNDTSVNTEEPLPFIFRRCIESRFEYREINNIQEFDLDPHVVNVFPFDYFSPKHWKTKEMQMSDNTYSIHHFAASWKSESPVASVVTPSFILRFKSFICSMHSYIMQTFRKALCKCPCFRKILLCINSKDVCFIKQNLFIHKADYTEFGNCRSVINPQNVEFINPDESKYKNSIRGFYPIMRLKTTGVEIHIRPNYLQKCSKLDLLSIVASDDY